MFFGRSEELKKLNREITSEKSRMVLIYGRRRVGKSELIKQALNNCKVSSVYYECKEVTEKSNVEGMCNIISEQFNLPKLGMDTIEEVLEYMFKLASKEKMVLVLDEYPYLRKNIKGMDSILQSLVDKYGESSKLTLVILGSYVDVMRSLLAHANPLFGRVDLVINLKQMDYMESSLFYPNYSVEDKVRIYSVFGGIPYYNKLIDDSKTVRENIIELIASPDARLENEVSMYLNGEISKIVNANEVFGALSKGFSRYSDILSQSHVSSGPTLVDVLDKLVKMEVVEKTAPINEERNKKKVGYYICDNLSMFYFRYIFRFASQMKIMETETFYDKYIAEDFESKYVPHRFEEICKQYLIRKNKRGLMNPTIEKIGKYYYNNPVSHTNGEFDIVTEDEKGYVFYEVKFKKNPITPGEILDEIEQVKNTNIDCYKYAFISRAGFAGEKIENVEYINLEEIYK